MTTTTKKRFRSYTYSNSPHLLPLGEQVGDFSEYDDWCAGAGFGPEDEEATACVLAEDWNGHRAGAIVLTGRTVEGHPFAVEVTG